MMNERNSNKFKIKKRKKWEKKLFEVKSRRKKRTKIRKSLKI